MPVYWIPNLLVSLSAPVTKDNRYFLTAWWTWEGGNGGPKRNVSPSAKYNWLNSMTPVLGSSAFNAVGVQNYPTYLSGIYATRKTLLDPTKVPYKGLVHALKAGNPMSTSWRSEVAAGLSMWVSGSPDANRPYAQRVIDTALAIKHIAEGS